MRACTHSGTHDTFSLASPSPSSHTAYPAAAERASSRIRIWRVSRHQKAQARLPACIPETRAPGEVRRPARLGAPQPGSAKPRHRSHSQTEPVQCRHLAPRRGSIAPIGCHILFRSGAQSGARRQGRPLIGGAGDRPGWWMAGWPARECTLWLMGNACSKMLNQLPAPRVCLFSPRHLACWSLHGLKWLGPQLAMLQ